MTWLRMILPTAISIIVLAALRWTTPDYSTITGPIVTTGAVGQTKQARLFSVAVKAPQLAERLRFRSFGKEFIRDTGGIWAVVPVQAAARTTTTNIQGIAWMTADGRQYDHSNRIRGLPLLLKGRALQPGLPERGILIFELPRSALQGGSVLLSHVPSPPLDSQLRIALTGQIPTEVRQEIDLDDLTDR